LVGIALRATALGDELVEGRDARLALGLAGLRRRAHPLELAGDLLLLRQVGLLLLGETLLLGVEPLGVVALEGEGAAAVELEDPLHHLVEEVAVVGDEQDAAGVLLKVTLEPGDR